MGGDRLTIDAMQSKDNSALCQQCHTCIIIIKIMSYTYHIAHPLSKFLGQFPKW